MSDEGDMISQFTIRPATAADAERLAALSGQLGYPAAADAVRRRLAALIPTRGHTVYVAVAADGIVSGWLHVHLHETVMEEPLAEVGGLVVDESCRGQGVGRLLMAQAEEWAREQGCVGVYIRSNVIRQDAHRFYQDLGYQVIKSQLALRRYF